MRTAYDVFKKCTAGFYVLLMSAMLVLLLIFQPFLNYMCKKSFLQPNAVLLLLALLLSILLTKAIWKKQRRVEHALMCNSHSNILLGCVILLFVQVTICCNTYFVSGWDSGMVLSQAYRLASGESMDVSYFSQYPNNLLLLWFYSLIFRACFAFGVTEMILGTYVILVIQCVISTVTGFLLYDLCLHFTRSYIISFSSWLYYAVFIGISPWLLIPYSDSMGLIFPVLLLWLYQKQRKSKKRWAIWLLMGLVTAIGYRIKPQIVIMTVAIILVEIFAAFQNGRQKARILQMLKHITLLALTAVVTQAVCTAFLIPATHMEGLDSKRSFGPTHFLMMGLNDKKDGVYYEPDVEFSASFDTPAQRERANMNVVAERLRNYGCAGLLKHLAKKSLVNYGDGTFAWGAEGSFYLQLLPDGDNLLSPLLKQILYNNGKYYVYFSSIEQALWLLLLFAALCSAPFMWKKRNCQTLLTAVLSMVGLTVFELLFEARARYLYIYTPVLIFIGAVGWKCFYEAIENILTKRGYRTRNKFFL
jgi:hypothetical protein